MRIAVLANAASVHTQRWSSALAERGHVVEVLSIREGEIAGAGVQTVRVGRSTGAVTTLLSYLRLLLSAKRRVRRFAPDVVHAHYAVTHGVIAALRSPAPVVLTVWGSDVMRGDRAVRWPLRWVARFAVRRAAAVTSASGAMADVVASFTGRRPQIVRFGVDTSRFAAGTRPAERPFTIGFLKGLRERYAPDVLIEAMPLVLRSVPDARLTMAGDGPMRAALRARAEKLRVAGRVDLVGQVDPADVPRFLDGIDVLVNPSRTEAFGVVLLEAAAAGVPVVATSVGGTSEAMISGETGLLVPPESPSDLARAIVGLASDPDRRHRMGAAGREFVAGRFEWAAAVDHMERVLQDAVQGAA